MLHMMTISLQTISSIISSQVLRLSMMSIAAQYAARRAPNNRLESDLGDAAHPFRPLKRSVRSRGTTVPVGEVGCWGTALSRWLSRDGCRRRGMGVMRCVSGPGHGKTKILCCSPRVFANKPGLARGGDLQEMPHGVQQMILRDEGRACGGYGGPPSSGRPGGAAQGIL